MTIWELIALAKSGGGGHIDATLFKFKGSVLTTDDLPDTAENGDVYHVDEDAEEYVWIEDYWEAIGQLVDLEEYRKFSELTWAEYQALSNAEKNNGTYYSITDRENIPSAQGVGF